MDDWSRYLAQGTAMDSESLAIAFLGLHPILFVLSPVAGPIPQKRRVRYATGHNIRNGLLPINTASHSG